MKFIWSYHLVALCVSLTSARIIDFPGNKNGSQDNLVSNVENEKILAPPTTSGLIIDSNGYPGNSNGEEIENFKPESSQLSFVEVLKSQLNKIKSKYDIIPFGKEDISNLENSKLCKMMCESGVKMPPCKCD